MDILSIRCGLTTSLGASASRPLHLFSRVPLLIIYLAPFI
ncbi:unnamed protein product [Brassica oleracea]